MAINDAILRAIFRFDGNGPSAKVDIAVALPGIGAGANPDRSALPGIVDCLLYGGTLGRDINVVVKSGSIEFVTLAGVAVHGHVIHNIGNLNYEKVIRCGRDTSELYGVGRRHT